MTDRWVWRSVVLGCVVLLMIWAQGCVERVLPCEGVCKASERCVDGVCVLQCMEGLFRCGSVCVDPWKDTQHCGGCGEVCPSGQRCVDGLCEEPCPELRSSRCDGICVDLKSDRAHCGSCTRRCAPGQICFLGECRCGAGLTLCGERCVDTSTQVEHCGSCGLSCEETERCIEGLCVRADCPPVTPISCYGGCTDLKTNHFHCGSCGKSCASGLICASATCQCAEGMTDCDGLCVDTKHTRAHCGGCGNACKEGQVCADGQCVASCPAATSTLCYGGCVDIKSNALHCGGCGQRCESGLLCKQGVCCQERREACGGLCVDLQTHREHCGGCGQACASGSLCELGQCCKASACSFAAFFGNTSVTGSEIGTRIRIAPQGHVYVIGGYVTGSWSLSNGVTFPELPNSAHYIARFDQGGEAVWGYPIPFQQDGNHEFVCLDVGPGGDMYVAGMFSGMISIAGQQLTSSGDSEIFVARITSAGRLLWAKSLGGNQYEFAADLAVDAQGNMYVVGSTLSTSMNGVSIGSRGRLDGFLARFDANGKLAWVKGYGGTNQDFSFGVDTDTQGNVYMITTVDDTGSGVARFGSFSAKSSYRAGVLSMLDASGTTKWIKVFDAAKTTIAFSELRIYNGRQGPMRIYLGGRFEGSATFGTQTLTSNGSQDALLLALDGSGKVMWSKLGQNKMPGKYVDVAWAIGIADDGTVHVGGYFESPIFTLDQQELRSAGGADGWLARFSPQGKLLSLYGFGGGADDKVRGIDVSAKGETFVIGNTTSRVFTFLNKAYKTFGGGDLFFLRVKK